ncbi:MAG TPA: hypothetical protein VHL78_07450 [Actinomycetota bacterium]|nr:hypothetical protein [Actinomycetota bacterium]
MATHARSEEELPAEPPAEPASPTSQEFEPEPASSVSGNDAGGQGHGHGTVPAPAPPSRQPVETGPAPQAPRPTEDQTDEASSDAPDESRNATFFPEEPVGGEGRDSTAYRETREAPPEHEPGDAQTVRRE